MRSLNRASRLSLTALAMLSCMVIGGQAGYAEDDTPHPYIATQGHGEIKAHPDAAQVQIQVETRDKLLKTAKSQNTQQMHAIINALKSLNIPGLKLETRAFSVTTLQDYTDHKMPRFLGYQVSNTLSVTLNNADAAKLGEYSSQVVDCALNNNASNVSDLRFYNADLNALRREALQLAVEDAKNNAQVMAKAAGVTLLGLYGLDNNTNTYVPNYPVPLMMKRAMAAADAAAPESTPVEVGETTITSDVSARFKI